MVERQISWLWLSHVGGKNKAWQRLLHPPTSCRFDCFFWGEENVFDWFGMQAWLFLKERECYVFEWFGMQAWIFLKERECFWMVWNAGLNFFEGKRMFLKGLECVWIKQKFDEVCRMLEVAAMSSPSMSSPGVINDTWSFSRAPKLVYRFACLSILLFWFELAQTFSVISRSHLASECLSKVVGIRLS